MCHNVYAPGSRDLCIDTIRCADRNCPMQLENSVPMNAAAVRQREQLGVPPHPLGHRPGESMDDVLARVSALFR